MGEHSVFVGGDTPQKGQGIASSIRELSNQIATRVCGRGLLPHISVINLDLHPRAFHRVLINSGVGLVGHSRGNSSLAMGVLLQVW